MSPTSSDSGSSAPRKPAPLRAGDRVAVVAPASPFDRALFERGIAALQDQLRLEPAFGDGLFAHHAPGGKGKAFLAGDDARRAAELRVALADPVARLIVLARGGYGIARLLAGAGMQGAGTLRLEEIAASPRLLLGYSDATVLHELWSRAGVPSIHGPMCTQLGEEPSATARLRALLFGTEPGPIALDADRLRVPARAGSRWEPVRGVLRGGNLATLASLCGTALQPRYRGCLVVLEDLNEEPYRLDRLLTQLLLSGALDGVRGVIVGDLVSAKEKQEQEQAGHDVGRAETVAERLATLGVPVAFGAPIGHAGRNQPVALGCLHELDAEAGLLTPLEAPTAAALV